MTQITKEQIESLGWEYVPFIRKGEWGERWYDEFTKDGYTLIGPASIDDWKITVRKENTLILHRNFRTIKDLEKALNEVL